MEFASATKNTLILTGFIVLLILVVIYLIVRLVKSEKRKNNLELKYNELERKVNNLQLENLESKLNPHLFKNVLNTIQSHAYQTYFALDKLANVLDYILYESRRKFVTPKEEIEFAFSLIEINKIKLSPLFDLKVKSKINETEPLYNQELLAPLISVDLIENAFKHADIHSPEAFISITLGFSENTFSLNVSNKISGKSTLTKTHSGIGAQTLEQRLRIIYKDNYKLERFSEGEVYYAHLKINLLEYKAKMLAAGR
jgi:sensor histidine kinase YesM